MLFFKQCFVLELFTRSWTGTTRCTGILTLHKVDLQIQTKAAKSISPHLCTDRRQRWRTPWCFSTPRKKLWSASSPWKRSWRRPVCSWETTSLCRATGWAPPPCSRFDSSMSPHEKLWWGGVWGGQGRIAALHCTAAVAGLMLLCFSLKWKFAVWALW